jgi:hypothetical protein
MSPRVANPPARVSEGRRPVRQFAAVRLVEGFGQSLLLLSREGRRDEIDEAMENVHPLFRRQTSDLVKDSLRARH